MFEWPTLRFRGTLAIGEALQKCQFGTKQNMIGCSISLSLWHAFNRSFCKYNWFWSNSFRWLSHWRKEARHAFYDWSGRRFLATPLGLVRHPSPLDCIFSQKVVQRNSNFEFHHRLTTVSLYSPAKIRECSSAAAIGREAETRFVKMEIFGVTRRN